MTAGDVLTDWTSGVRGELGGEGGDVGCLGGGGGHVKSVAGVTGKQHKLVAL